MRTERQPRQAERPEPAICINEGCPRPARPGEGYCDPCGLERSLFRRDLRAASGRPSLPAR